MIQYALVICGVSIPETPGDTEIHGYSNSQIWASPPKPPKPTGAVLWLELEGFSEAHKDHPQLPATSEGLKILILVFGRNKNSICYTEGHVKRMVPPAGQNGPVPYSTSVLDYFFLLHVQTQFKATLPPSLKLARFAVFLSFCIHSLVLIVAVVFFILQTLFRVIILI